MDGSPRPAARRRWPLAAAAVAVALVVSGASIYYVSLAKPTPVLPTVWTLPAGCHPECVEAASPQNLYQLAEEEDFGIATAYTLNAYNWSSGIPAWPSINVSIGEPYPDAGPGPFLLFSGGTLALVFEGTAESVFSPYSAYTVTLAYLTVFVLEWNSSTGAFLGEQDAGNLGGSFSTFFVAQNDGWIAVAFLPPPWTDNLTLVTFSEPNHSSGFAVLHETVDVGAIPGNGVPVQLPMTMANGVISFSVAGAGNLTTLVNGRTGQTVWQGALKDWGGENDYLGTGAPITNVVRDGGNLVYIGENSSGGYLLAFNLTSLGFGVVANLAGISASQAQLTALPNGELVVTDEQHNAFWALSADGAKLWNRSVFLSVDAGPPGGGVSGQAYSPFLLGGDSLLLTLVQTGGWGQLNSTYTYSVPFYVVNAGTGIIRWESSYTTSMSIGSVGPFPTNYYPLLTSGPYLLYQLSTGGHPSVARIPGVPF